MAAENNASNHVVGGDSPASNTSPTRGHSPGGDSPLHATTATIAPPPPPPQATPEVAVNATSVKKRSRMEVGESSGTACARGKGDAAAAEQPQLDHPCSLCDRRFASRQAVFGHMRVHRDRAWRGALPPPVFSREEFADVLHLLAGGGEAEEAAVPPTGAEALLAPAALQDQGGAAEAEEEANEFEIDLNEPPVYRVPDLNFPPPSPPAAN